MIRIMIAGLLLCMPLMLASQNVSPAGRIAGRVTDSSGAVVPAAPIRIEALHLEFSQWRDVAVVDPGDLAPDLVADRVMALAAEGRALLFDHTSA